MKSIPPGSEYRSWLLFYSLPVLSGLLPDPYFTHLSLLVAAMCIYHADEITASELERAKSFLDVFYQHYGNLYGMFSMATNYLCTFTTHAFTF